MKRIALAIGLLLSIVAAGYIGFQMGHIETYIGFCEDRIWETSLRSLDLREGLCWAYDAGLY